MQNAAGLKIIALISAGLAAAVLLLFAVGETAGGDRSGLGHLIVVVPIGLLLWLGWKFPLWGGICFLLLGLVASFIYLDALRGPGWLAPFLIIIAPMLFSGFMLLAAARLEHKVA